MTEEKKIEWLVNHILEDEDGNGGFHIRAGLANSAVVDYEVRSLMLYDDGRGPPLRFEMETQNEGIVATTDIEKGILYLEGSISFDGCSHNNFGEGGYIHGCSRQEMARLGPLFNKLFDIALELMPSNGEFLS